MTVVSIKPVIEYVLEKARALAAHHWIARNWPEVAVWQVTGEYFDLPLAFGIGSVAVGINFSCQVVDPRSLPLNIRGVLRIQQGRSGNRVHSRHEDLLWGSIEVLDGDRALADYL